MQILDPALQTQCGQYVYDLKRFHRDYFSCKPDINLFSYDDYTLVSILDQYSWLLVNLGDYVYRTPHRTYCVLANLHIY